MSNDPRGRVHSDYPGESDSSVGPMWATYPVTAPGLPGRYPALEEGVAHGIPNQYSKRCLDAWD